MGGFFILTSFTIGAYNTAEKSGLPGWVWACITLLLFVGVMELWVMPRIIAALIAGVVGYAVMFGYRVVADK